MTAHCLCHQEGALDVDIEYLVKVLFLNEFREIARGHADIVDENIDPTECRNRRVDGLCDMGLLGNIQFYGENLSSRTLEFGDQAR